MKIGETLGFSSGAVVRRFGPEEPPDDAVRLELGGVHLAMEPAQMASLGLPKGEAGLRGLAAGLDPAELPGLGTKFGKYTVTEGGRGAAIWVRTVGRSKPRASVLHLEDLGPPRPAAEVEIERVLDIHVEVAVVLGETMLPLEDIARLTDGSVVQLDAFAGDPVLILVQGRPYAKGEILVVDDQYAARVTEILQDSAIEGTA